MKEFANLFGLITLCVFTLAIFNFFVKFIFKNYITKLIKQKTVEDKKYNTFINIYKIIMKYIVKYHKIIGGIVVITLLSHIILELKYRWLSVTGLTAAILMATVVIIGMLGATVFKKKPRGTWLIIHRIVAFSLIIFILLHLIVKR